MDYLIRSSKLLVGDVAQTSFSYKMATNSQIVVFKTRKEALEPSRRYGYQSNQRAELYSKSVTPNPSGRF